MLFPKPSHPDNLLQPKHFLRFGKRVFHYCDKALDQLFDLKYGIETYREVPAHKLDAFFMSISFTEKYGPTRRRFFTKILKNLDVDLSEYQFIDLGSGKGRVVLQAVDYNFKKISGVEFSESLVKQCNENVRIYKRFNKKVQQEIHIVLDDVLNFKPDSGKKIYYLFNPFKKEILSQMLSTFIDNGYIGKEDILIYLNPKEESCFSEELFTKTVLLKSKNRNFRACCYQLKV